MYFLTVSLCAQEKESAAVSLEDNRDEFQENFFEALKQKGIENYDKAVNSLLECKRLEPGNPVVDHELAKVYQASGKPLQSMEYAIVAVTADPDNLWYLETLVSGVLQQGKTVEMIKDRIPYKNTFLKENLARVYYRMNNYQAALEILKEVNNSVFSERLSSKIRDSLAQQDLREEIELPDENPLEAYMNKLQHLLEKEDFEELEPLSEEALEQFPSYPYFYYIRGLVLNQNMAYEEAAEVMEEGLSYILNDAQLTEKMYKALAFSYKALGNTSKANMYLSKIKSGS